eukprot:TRINITY_DN30814_c0_g1_i1.p1 TRINITY_DN30814_c0_g1~~TRINITY_DN30814_c0_g1_i1.p1  ORF type:complete len:508 (+),score=31.87 TRINITY_DN30814_c0_g1_i1:28-1551(+)
MFSPKTVVSGLAIIVFVEFLLSVVAGDDFSYLKDLSKLATCRVSLAISIGVVIIYYLTEELHARADDHTDELARTHSVEKRPQAGANTVHAKVKAGYLESAERNLERIPVFGPTASDWIECAVAVIHGNIKQSRLEAAERWLVKLSHRSQTNATHCVESLISAYLRQGDISKPERLLTSEELKTTCLTAATYRMMIDGYEEAGNVPKQSEWIQKMRLAGVPERDKDRNVVSSSACDEDANRDSENTHAEDVSESCMTRSEDASGEPSQVCEPTGVLEGSDAILGLWESENKHTYEVWRSEDGTLGCLHRNAKGWERLITVRADLDAGRFWMEDIRTYYAVIAEWNEHPQRLVWHLTVEQTDQPPLQWWRPFNHVSAPSLSSPGSPEQNDVEEIESNWLSVSPNVETKGMVSGDPLSGSWAGHMGEIYEVTQTSKHIWEVRGKFKVFTIAYDKHYNIYWWGTKRKYFLSGVDLKRYPNSLTWYQGGTYWWVYKQEYVWKKRWRESNPQ